MKKLYSFLTVALLLVAGMTATRAQITDDAMLAVTSPKVAKPAGGYSYDPAVFDTTPNIKLQFSAADQLGTGYRIVVSAQYASYYGNSEYVSMDTLRTAASLNYTMPQDWETRFEMDAWTTVLSYYVKFETEKSTDSGWQKVIANPTVGLPFMVIKGTPEMKFNSPYSDIMENEERQTLSMTVENLKVGVSEGCAHIEIRLYKGSERVDSTVLTEAGSYGPSYPLPALEAGTYKVYAKLFRVEADAVTEWKVDGRTVTAEFDLTVKEKPVDVFIQSPAIVTDYEGYAYTSDKLMFYKEKPAFTFALTKGGQFGNEDGKYAVLVQVVNTSIYDYPRPTFTDTVYTAAYTFPDNWRAELPYSEELEEWQNVYKINISLLKKEEGAWKDVTNRSDYSVFREISFLYDASAEAPTPVLEDKGMEDTYSNGKAFTAELAVEHGSIGKNYNNTKVELKVEGVNVNYSRIDTIGQSGSYYFYGRGDDDTYYGEYYPYNKKLTLYNLDTNAQYKITVSLMKTDNTYWMKDGEIVSKTITVGKPGVETKNEIRALSGVSVYPNPTGGAFNVKVPAGAKVEVFAANGARLNNVQAKADVQGFTLTNSGVYFVKVSYNNQTTVKRVIVK